MTELRDAVDALDFYEVLFLLDTGADVNAKTKGWETALGLAKKKSRECEDIVHLLKQHGAK